MINITRVKMARFIVVLLFFITTLYANDRAIVRLKQQNQQRVALIIGNNNYESLSKLKNPINDARLMKSTLESRGFEIIYKENATKREMKKLMKQFAHKLRQGGVDSVGLYYFAGHGINMGGNNYLVGVNSLIDDKDEVEYETLALNYVTKKMQTSGNKLNIVILDACRNDPFNRSGGGGLAPVSNAKGLFVAYATEAGSVASDGKSGKNGVFTKYLVQNIKKSGESIESVFKSTRRDVYQATNGVQSPGVYNQIRGDFFFTLPTKNQKPKPIPQVNTNINTETQLWNMVKSSNTIADYDYYISSYPNGKYLMLANYKIKKLKPKKVKAQKPTKNTSSGETWIDRDTSLEWQVKIDKKEYTWSDAKNYCGNLTLNAENDWRLPNRDELNSLMTKESHKNPKSYSERTYIKKPLLKSMDMKYQYFWSSTEKNSSAAWVVFFYNGNDNYFYKSRKDYVRCVRDGQ